MDNAKSVKIAFIVPSIDISGGVYVIFEHAARLSKKKYDVVMIFEGKIEVNSFKWFPEAKYLKWVSPEEAKIITFDVVISTYWLTCYSAHQYKANHYIYFNQSVESKFFPEKAWPEKKYADSTYYLGMPIITEASWIKAYLNENYGINAHLVLNGIRKDVFKPSGSMIEQRNNDILRVLVEGPLGVPFKNTVKAIQLSLKSRADEVWLLTNTAIKRFAGVNRVFSKLPIFNTPEIYRSCDLIVKLSLVEGMFGPPLEMFHCGGTAIVYDVTGHEEYVKHNINAYILDTHDEKGVIESINYLKDKPDELKRLKNGALATAESWNDWDYASEKFDQALQSILKTNACSPSQLQLRTKTMHFSEWYVFSNSRAKRIIKSIKKWLTQNNLIPSVMYDIKRLYQKYI